MTMIAMTMLPDILDVCGGWDEIVGVGWESDGLLARRVLVAFDLRTRPCTLTEAQAEARELYWRMPYKKF